MTPERLRDLEHRLELLLCQVSARLYPSIEHPLKPDQRAVYDADLDRRIREGLRELKALPE